MATLISHLHHTNQKIGVISMCYGIGGVSYFFLKDVVNNRVVYLQT